MVRAPLLPGVDLLVADPGVDGDVGRERDVGVGGADHEVDLVEDVGHGLVGLGAGRFAPGRRRRGSSSARRSSRPKAISLVRSSLQPGQRSPSSSLQARPGWPAPRSRSEVGQRARRRRRARARRPWPAPRPRPRPAPAPRRARRGAEGRARSPPACPAGRGCRGRAPSPRPRGGSTGRARRSRRRRRTSGRRRAPSGPWQPITTVMRVRSGCAGPRGMRPAVPFMPDQAVEAGRDADRAAAVAAGGDA